MNKRYKIFISNIIILLVLLIIVEIILSFNGYRPGITSNQLNITKLKDIQFESGYIVDSLGIQKSSKEASFFVKKHIASDEVDYTLEIDALHPKRASGTLYGIGRNFLEISKGIVENDFSIFINNIKTKDSKDEIEQVYLDYTKSPINSDGFRSIPFKDYNSERKKVLLLGDSFTWGHQVKNITSSFPENLMAKGHIIFNTGISGTDLPQYAAIAEQYIEILQPDIVIINICAINDFVKYDRKISQDVPIYYLTNIGPVFSCPQGVCFYEKDSIIQNLKNQYFIPTENSTADKLLAKTRITTQIWEILVQKDMFGFEYSQDVGKFWKAAENIEKNGSYSVNRKYLEKTDSICQKYNAKLITSIIPDASQIKISDEELNIKMDGYQPYHQIMNLESSDYKKGDNHFNEKGHKKYAEYLDSLIQSIPKK
jgi:lysophospholipase L1-like esterase